VHHLEAEVARLKSECLKELLVRDVGLRGVMQAYGDLWARFDLPPWREYSEWFLGGLNQTWAAGRFHFDRSAKSPLRQVVISHTEKIMNYRLEDAEDALGPWLALHVGASRRPPKEWVPDWSTHGHELLDKLEMRLRRGYRTEVRPELRERFPKGGKPLTAAVSEEAGKRAARQKQRLERHLEEIAAGHGNSD